MSATRRGIAIVTYNRGEQLGELIEAVQKTKPKNCRVVVADDGSTDNTPSIVSGFNSVVYVRGANLGVGANKNRALFTLQDCHFLAIIEDDLFPTDKYWFQRYEQAVQITDIHHFCRVQDKEVEETIPSFGEWMAGKNMKPVYGPSPRGDLTFISCQVLRKVGGFHPSFEGVGYAHGEWSNRVYKAGLIPHPLKWMDIQESRDVFIQKGDEEGGRWNEEKAVIKKQMKANHALAKRLRKTGYVFHDLTMP